MIYARHAPDRQTMGSAGAVIATSAGSPGSQRTPMEQSQARTGRYSLDSKDGGPVETSSLGVSTLPNLSSMVSAVVSRRNLEENRPRTGSGPCQERQVGFGGGFHRWLLLGGKKRGLGVGKTKRGKGTKIMAVTDGTGLPLAAGTENASPHEVRLVERTLDESFIDELPDRLIGDKAYDSDRLDERLWQERGVELIAPHRKGRRTPTQDGRPLRRYKRRWRVERLFAWLHSFRRLVIRYEYHPENFLGFLHFACVIILMRYL